MLTWQPSWMTATYPVGERRAALVAPPRKRVQSLPAPIKEPNMSIKLNPYLNFEGNTREAMEFYNQVFGGELTISTFGEYPDMPTPEEYKDKVMHAQLVADDITIMASEGQPGKPVDFGDNVSLSLSGDEKDRLTRYFNELSAGGEVIMPLQAQIWGDTFGACKDKFGVYWLVNIAGTS
jgi:PhnB protein